MKILKAKRVNLCTEGNDFDMNLQPEPGCHWLALRCRCGWVTDPNGSQDPSYQITEHLEADFRRKEVTDLFNKARIVIEKHNLILNDDTNYSEWWSVRAILNRPDHPPRPLVSP